jgi:hypothetical protein
VYLDILAIMGMEEPTTFGNKRRAKGDREDHGKT